MIAINSQVSVCKNNLKNKLFFLTIYFHIFSLANDGAFYANGNQLIPITESKITVKKEILLIERVNAEYLRIQVHYEFFNPGADKKVLTGFEAVSPSGDVDGTPRNGKHPYIYDFSAKVNGEFIATNVAIVHDSMYYQNEKFKTVSEAEIKSISDINNVDFKYVYYFEPLFNKGITTIDHSYLLKLSGSVDLKYQFTYILTAATRWANNQIDDFTLILDLGEFQHFYIPMSFFDTATAWTFLGQGKIKSFSDTRLDENGIPTAEVISQNGQLIFQQLNFKPKDELSIYAWNFFGACENFDPAQCDLPFDINDQQHIDFPNDEMSQKILRNLPFARRGYIFKNANLQAYYESMNWYIPNPDYEANPELLTLAEQIWIEKFSE
jgi:hypothetical protein